MRRVILLSSVLAFWASAAYAADDSVRLLEKHLQAGTLSAGQTALEAALKQNPKDDQARFGLGALQFVKSIETLSQSLYRHGFLQGIGRMAVLLGPPGDLPVPNNPDPQQINYDEARQIVQTFVSNLAKAEATLAAIKSDDVRLPLRFGLIRLDFDGDGKATDDETLWQIYTRVNRRAGVTAEAAKEFVIAFDAGDVAWLRGYCHLLMGLGEASLAHDWHELFERTGHLMFTKVESPYKFLAEDVPGAGQPFSFAKIADLIAWIHLINFKVAEPKRMEAALAHFEAMVTHSRRSWELILKEKDDDNEWIPSPGQTGVIPNVRVTEEMVEGWRAFLAEAETILKGTKLVPFWRGNGEAGLNLRKVFTQPRPFDLVIWIQGTGAAPYLEKGEVTDQAVWERLMRVFQGEFIGFALWFN
jgi:hypothetical protein